MIEIENVVYVVALREQEEMPVLRLREPGDHLLHVAGEVFKGEGVRHLAAVEHHGTAVLREASFELVLDGVEIGADLHERKSSSVRELQVTPVATVWAPIRGEHELVEVGANHSLVRHREHVHSFAWRTDEENAFAGEVLANDAVVGTGEDFRCLDDVGGFGGRDGACGDVSATGEDSFGHGKRIAARSFVMNICLPPWTSLCAFASIPNAHLNQRCDDHEDEAR